MNKPLIALVGPTASGKSALAFELAKRFNGEIICADSRTVYKGMDIGTAKPSTTERQQIAHHVLDVVAPNQPFSAAQFKQHATLAINDIRSRGKLPLLVGGSGLYIDAVLFDFKFGQPADPKSRAALEALSIEELQLRCLSNNIRIPYNSTNRRHLVRAIETGVSSSPSYDLPKNNLVVGITIAKEDLLSRIIQRTAFMLKQDVLDETHRLGQKYGWESEAMTGNIYRWLRAVIENRMSLHSALEAFIRSDLQLAKRQQTWFKRNPHISWGSVDELTTKIEQFLRTKDMV